MVFTSVMEEGDIRIGDKDECVVLLKYKIEKHKHASSDEYTVRVGLALGFESGYTVPIKDEILALSGLRKLIESLLTVEMKTKEIIKRNGLTRIIVD